jgi:hypothetical protein
MRAHERFITCDRLSDSKASAHYDSDFYEQAMKRRWIAAQKFGQLLDI